jgi:hypothetical protein
MGVGAMLLLAVALVWRHHGAGSAVLHASLFDAARRCCVPVDGLGVASRFAVRRKGADLAAQPAKSKPAAPVDDPHQGASHASGRVGLLRVVIIEV